MVEVFEKVHEFDDVFVGELFVEADFLEEVLDVLLGESGGVDLFESVFLVGLFVFDFYNFGECAVAEEGGLADLEVLADSLAHIIICYLNFIKDIFLKFRALILIFGK